MSSWDEWQEQFLADFAIKMNEAFKKIFEKFNNNNIANQDISVKVSDPETGNPNKVCTSIPVCIPISDNEITANPNPNSSFSTSLISFPSPANKVVISDEPQNCIESGEVYSFIPNSTDNNTIKNNNSNNDYDDFLYEGVEY